MSEPERKPQSEVPKPEKAPSEENNATAAYTTTAVGIGLVVAAILVIFTAGTPAAGIGFVIGAAGCLGWGVPRLVKSRSLLASDNRELATVHSAEKERRPSVSDSKERELLLAIRDNGGAITPAEAAMETSLTVREADRMLTELASSGHLKVGSEDGALVYSLPKRESRELR